MATQQGYFSLVDSNNIKGGLYQVDNYLDLLKLNASTHFKDGMLCYVSKYDKYLQYSIRTRKWAEVNIERTVFPDASINIDGETYSIFSKDNVQDLILELVALKYTPEWQLNHLANMRKFPELYQKNENKFQQWYDLCKKAAYAFFYNDDSYYDFENREGDENNIFDYPALKKILLLIQSDISYFYYATYDLETDIDIFVDNKNDLTGNIEEKDGITYIRYPDNNDGEDINVIISLTPHRGNVPVDLISCKVIDTQTNTVIYNVSKSKLLLPEIIIDSSDGSDSSDSSDSSDIENITYIDTTNIVFKLPVSSNGIYDLAITIKDDDRDSKDYTFYKKFALIPPYCYGCSKFSDITVILENIISNEDLKYSNITTYKQIHNLLKEYNFTVGESFEETMNNTAISCGISDELMLEFIINVLNPEILVNLSEDIIDMPMYTNVILKSFYDIVYNELLEKWEIAGIKPEYNRSDSITEVFKELTETDDTLYLCPLEKVLINNKSDGNYVWICIPTSVYSGNPPKISVSHFPFPLNENIYNISIGNLDYTCFRSIGNKGIEAGTLELNIKY